jgi:hypothetical protein
MGNGPVVNRQLVKSTMKSKGITAAYLASKLERSVTYARNVMNGHFPKKDWQVVLSIVSKELGLTINEMVIGELPPRRKAA